VIDLTRRCKHKHAPDRLAGRVVGLFNAEVDDKDGTDERKGVKTHEEEGSPTLISEHLLLELTGKHTPSVLVAPESAGKAGKD
jgi:hypothetical protein